MSLSQTRAYASTFESVAVESRQLGRCCVALREQYTEVVQSDLDDTLKQAELERKFRALDKAGQDDGGIDDEIRQSISGVGVVISDSERLEDLEMKVDGMGAQLDAILRILQAQPS